MISERASRNIVRAIITIIVLMILPPWKEMWVYLQSVDFRFDHVFSWAYEPIRNFDKYQEPLNLLVKEIDSFVESEPHFFDEFTGECSVNVVYMMMESFFIAKGFLILIVEFFINLQ